MRGSCVAYATPRVKGLHRICSLSINPAPFPTTNWDSSSSHLKHLAESLHTQQMIIPEEFEVHETPDEPLPGLHDALAIFYMEKIGIFSEP